MQSCQNPQEKTSVLHFYARKLRKKKAKKKESLENQTKTAIEPISLDSLTLHRMLRKYSTVMCFIPAGFS